MKNEQIKDQDKVRLLKDLRLAIGDCWLTIHQNTPGVVTHAEPTHPSGPCCLVRFPINLDFSIETCVDTNDLSKLE
jgi:hypothetical protein